jgi:hypothetical protein
MKKLKLDLDRLAVATFETAREQPTVGTVAANEYTNTNPTCVYHCTWIGATCADTTCRC